MALRARAQDTFGGYLRATGHGTEIKALTAYDKFGPNMFEVPVPPFALLLKDHLVAPFFCFQVGGTAWGGVLWGGARCGAGRHGRHCGVRARGRGRMLGGRLAAAARATRGHLSRSPACPQIFCVLLWMLDEYW